MARAFLVALVVALAATTLGSCRAEPDRTVVALLLGSENSSRWTEFDEPSFRARLETACPDCVYLTANAAGDADAQADQLDDVLADGADVVVLNAVTSERGEELVERAGLGPRGRLRPLRRRCRLLRVLRRRRDRHRDGRGGGPPGRRCGGAAPAERRPDRCQRGGHQAGGAPGPRRVGGEDRRRARPADLVRHRGGRLGEPAAAPPSRPDPGRHRRGERLPGGRGGHRPQPTPGSAPATGRWSPARTPISRRCGGSSPASRR